MASSRRGLFLALLVRAFVFLVPSVAAMPIVTCPQNLPSVGRLALPGKVAYLRACCHSVANVRACSCNHVHVHVHVHAVLLDDQGGH